MALLTATTVARTGVDPVPVTAADAAGDEWVNTGQEFLLVKNASGGSINVTLDIKATVDSAAVTDPVVAVANGATKIIGPFPKGIYNDSVTNRAKATCSAVSSVTVLVLKCTPA